MEKRNYIRPEISKMEIKDLTLPQLSAIFSGGIDDNKKWKIDSTNLKDLERSVGLIKNFMHNPESSMINLDNKKGKDVLGDAFHLSLIDGFLSIKEDTWDNKKVNASDFDFDIPSDIIFKVNGVENACVKMTTLIKEIRNGLMHHRCLVCKEGVYINNPQIPNVHNIAFEARIQREFFEKFLKLKNIDRKITSYVFDIPEDFEVKIDKVLHSGKKKQLGDVVLGRKDESKDKGRKLIKESLEDLGKIKEINLSDTLKVVRDSEGDIIRIKETALFYLSKNENIRNLLVNFFKKHEPTKSNLEYALKHILKDDVVSLYNMEKYLKSLIEVFSNNISYSDFCNKVITQSLYDERKELLNKLKEPKDNKIFMHKKLRNIGEENVMGSIIEVLTHGEIKDWKILEMKEGDLIKFIEINYLNKSKFKNFGTKIQKNIGEVK